RAFVVSAPPPTALSALSLHDALPISPGGGVLAAEDLGGAHQRGRPLELLGGEQPQRVAHEHRDARRPVAGLLARAERALQPADRSEEHTSELQSRENLVCRLLLEKKK